MKTTNDQASKLREQVAASKPLQHTPAPWRATLSRNDGIRTWYITPVEAVIPADPPEGASPGFRISTEEAEANVRLMTAGPELIDACKLAQRLRAIECSILTDHKIDIIRRNELRDEGRQIEEKIRIAIAKAEGLAS